MFNKIASIKNIRIFQALNNNIFYLKPENILNSLDDNGLIKLKEQCNSIIKYGDNILLLDDSNRIIESFPGEIIFEDQISKTEENRIFFYKNRKPNRIYGVYTSGEVIFESNETSRDFSLFDNFIIENRSTILNKISIENELIWQFNLFQLGNRPYEDKTDKIEKVLGISHGNIWLTTKGGRLVALDTKTGEIAKKYSYYPSDSLLGYDTNLKIGKDTFLNEYDNQIYGMSGNFFQKINTENFTIEEELNYSSDPNGIGKFKNHYSFLLQGDYFTFIAQKDDNHSGIRHVGIFDYRKKELVWEYEVILMEEQKNGNELIRSQPLYMSGDKLYIKDFKNTLHIFELDK